jgi:hypothetical protein
MVIFEVATTTQSLESIVMDALHNINTMVSNGLKYTGLEEVQVSVPLTCIKTFVVLVIDYSL